MFQDFITPNDEGGGLHFGGVRMALLDIEAGYWGLRRQIEALVGRRLTNAVLQQAGTNGGASFARAFATDAATKIGANGTDAESAVSVLRDCIAAYRAAGFGNFALDEVTWPIGRITVRATNTFEAWMMQQHHQSSDCPICAYSAGVLVGFINAIADRRDIVCIERSCQACGDDACTFELIMDVTDQKRAEETLAHVNVMLEQKVGERTQKLATLLEVSQNVASTLELDPLLGLVLDQLRAVVAYDGASILELRDVALHLLAYRGPIPHQSARQLVFPLAEAGANRAVIQQQRPIMIADVLADDDPHAQAFRQTAASELDTTFGYVRSWMGVPLILRGKVLGMISLDHSQPDFYGEESAQLAQAFASQVAVFIENARLYENEQERRAVAEGLSDIVRILNSSRPLSEILNYIVVQASQLMGAAICTLHHIDYEEAFVRIEASHGLPPVVQDISGFPLLSSRADALILKREPVVSSRSTPPRLDPVVENKLDERVRRWRAALAAAYPAFLAVPLVVANEVYGSLAFYFEAPQSFNEETIALAMSLGEQAALAIDNAGLRRQAEQAAVAAERNRLARELHDAVTQTLFSASLIAELLPRLWQKDEAQGRERLAELRELTRGALAEMRTLLLELRPATLTESSLAELLRQLTEAIIGRSRLPVELKIEGERPLPPEIQVALYRIAQEALNNVVKHAHVDSVKVALVFEDEQVTLTVADDGRGFAVNDAGVQSLGLSIMRERAEKIGATLTIDSRPKQGATIQVRV